ncbi:MAG: hypothetical protein K5930_11410, partial [Treponemataceae bacterium]|nr:hypothetical protein [Treponemataceae bacterium]
MNKKLCISALLIFMLIFSFVGCNNGATPTEPKALSSISVTTAPAKVLYFAGAGESLNTAGMVVTA